MGHETTFPVFRRPSRRVRAVLMLAAISVCAGMPLCAWGDGVLTVTDLGTLGGVSSAAWGINSAGVVAGQSKNAAGFDRPVLWSGGQILDLGTLGGPIGAAYDIGDDAVVVGYARGSNGFDQGFVWDAALGMRRAPGLPAAQPTYCFARNASNRIVGSLFNSFGIERAFVLDPVLGLQDPLPGYTGMCNARGVNASGALTGERTGGYIAHADGSIESFTFIPTNLNDQELVVGANTAQQAAYWTHASGARVLLPTGALTPRKAWAVSGSGQIVGYGAVTGFQRTHGFLYTESGGVSDLNNLVLSPGIEITEARDINAAGQIVGTGYVQATGQTHAVLLTPTGGAARLYVDAIAPAGGNGQSWATAFRSLQDALDLAAFFPGVVQEIWVSQGRYLPSRQTIAGDAHSATFRLIPGVSLYGGFSGVETEREQRDWVAHPTVLSGDLAGDDAPGFVNLEDNAYHVVTATLPEFGVATLDGFTVSAGNAALVNSSHRSGGGVFSEFGSPVIANCTITGCSSVYNGGGLFLVGTRARVSGCTVIGNRAYGSGAGGHFEFRARVEGCTFANNIIAPSNNGQGAGASASGFAVLLNCTISGNSNQAGGAGGVVAGKIYNCRVFGNSSTSGYGGIFAGEAYNCLVYGNTAPAFAGGTGSFINSVIAYNHATGALAGGLDLSLATNTLTNCIVWGNTSQGFPGEQTQIRYNVSAPPSISFSSIQDWTGVIGGAGNNGANPLFVDPDGPDNIPGTADDDFRLTRPSSPGIDSGDSDALPSDADDIDNDGDLFELLPIDLAGNPRQVDDPQVVNTGQGGPPPVDRGAFEAAAPACYANCDGSTIPPVLNVLDFNCFLDRYASGNSYANCDGSTTPPVLNVLDFNCFLNRFAGGCP
jgi:probable HAF family extracellular repeat protein